MIPIEQPHLKKKIVKIFLYYLILLVHHFCSVKMFDISN